MDSPPPKAGCSSSFGFLSFFIGDTLLLGVSLFLRDAIFLDLRPIWHHQTTTVSPASSGTLPPSPLSRKQISSPLSASAPKMVGSWAAHKKVSREDKFRSYEEELAYEANLKAELKNIRNGEYGVQQEEECQRLNAAQRLAEAEYTKRNQKTYNLKLAKSDKEVELQQRVNKEKRRLQQLLIQPRKDGEAQRLARIKAAQALNLKRAEDIRELQRKRREEGPAALAATGAGVPTKVIEAEKKRLLELYEVEGSGEVGARPADRSFGAPSTTALEASNGLLGRWKAEEQRETGYMSRVCWTLELQRGACCHHSCVSTSEQERDQGKTTEGCWSVAEDASVLLSLGGRCVEYAVENGLDGKRLVCKPRERRGKILLPEYVFQPEVDIQQGPAVRYGDAGRRP